ncbi:MAG: hypothetical protein GYB68_16545, partial [Chloroflexi bacterium]|nr:hypothetical protein [Chloroflexota bacterium]
MPTSKQSLIPRDGLIAVALALLALSVYLTTSALRFHSIDEIASFSVTRSFVARGEFDGNVIFWTRAPLGRGSIVAQGSDGETYVVKDVAPSLLAAPFVMVGRVMGASSVRSALIPTPLVTALTVGLLYLISRVWGASQATGMLAALAFAFGSMAWP